jgi:D-aminopeptidase
MRLLAGSMLALSFAGLAAADQPARPRARELGLVVGRFPPGPLNAITDVAGVRVGQVTVQEGEGVRTGVTAVLPHAGNLFQEKVPAAIEVGNGFGKLVGATQVQELGQIETPILLTNTLAVWTVADAIVDHMLGLPGNEAVRSINPVVGETNDGTLNDIRSRPITRAHALRAIREATGGPVAEGAVGAGTGTICLGYKGGIGTSSRRLPPEPGGYTLGVLVQTNYGGQLEMAGVPLARPPARDPAPRPAGGSCLIVIATDAPVDAPALARIARRAILALARTGSALAHGSGDYAIAFSTAPALRIPADASRPLLAPAPRLRGEALDPLFQATVEATEEAIYNSLLRATTTTGYRGRTVEALPIDRVKEQLRKAGKIR